MKVKQTYVTFPHLLVSLRANTHNYSCWIRVNRCGGYACTMEEVGGVVENNNTSRNRYIIIQTSQKSCKTKVCVMGWSGSLRTCFLFVCLLLLLRGGGA